MQDRVADNAKGRVVAPKPRPTLAERTEGFAFGSGDTWAVHNAATARSRAGDDVIALTIGDPDFDTPTPIRDAAVASLDRGETHYSPAEGIPSLIDAISRFESGRLGRPIAADSVVVTQGAQNALFAVMQCIVGPGDEVISIDPAYPTFPGVIAAASGTITRAPLVLRDGDFFLDMSAVEAARSARTTAVLMNFPHNPTGATLSREDAEAIVAFCRAHGLWLICDEVYAEICFDDGHVSPASLPECQDLAIVVRSLSKSHAMTGWRCGWVLAPAPVAEPLQNLMNCMLFGGSGFIQAAAARALELNVADEMTQAYRRRRDIVASELAACAGIKACVPRSGIFMLLDIRPSGLSSQDYAWRLMREGDVALLPADTFSPLTAGFLRLSLCVPDDRIVEACRRIATFDAQL